MKKEDSKKEETWSLKEVINEMINLGEISYDDSNVYKKIKVVDKLANGILENTYCTGKKYKIPTSHKKRVKLLIKSLLDEETINGQTIYQIAQRIASLQRDIDKGIHIITPPSGVELVNKIIMILSNSNLNVDVTKLEKMKRYYTENQEPTKNQELLEYVKKAIEESEYAILNIPHNIIGIIVQEKSLGTLLYVIKEICAKWQDVIDFADTLILFKQSSPNQFKQIVFEKDLDESRVSPQLIKNIGIPKFLEKSIYTVEQIVVRYFIVDSFSTQNQDILDNINQVEYIGLTLRKLDLGIEEEFYTEILNAILAVNVMCSVFNQLNYIEEAYAKAYINVLHEIIINQLQID